MWGFVYLGKTNLRPGTRDLPLRPDCGYCCPLARGCGPRQGQQSPLEKGEVSSWAGLVGMFVSTSERSKGEGEMRKRGAEGGEMNEWG